MSDEKILVRIAVAVVVEAITNFVGRHTLDGVADRAPAGNGIANKRTASDTFADTNGAGNGQLRKIFVRHTVTIVVEAVTPFRDRKRRAFAFTPSDAHCFAGLDAGDTFTVVTAANARGAQSRTSATFIGYTVAVVVLVVAEFDRKADIEDA